MARIDVTRKGCTTEWTNAVRSTAVPKLSIADGKINTVALAPSTDGSTADTYAYTTIDSRTGKVVFSQTLGTGITSNTLQIAGNINRDRVLYQGTAGGVYRIAPRPRHQDHGLDRWRAGPISEG